MHNNRTILFSIKQVNNIKSLLQLEVVKDKNLYKSPITWISSCFCLQRFSSIFISSTFAIRVDPAETTTNRDHSKNLGLDITETFTFSLG